jgi:hypothetical protein
VISDLAQSRLPPPSSSRHCGSQPRALLHALPPPVLDRPWMPLPMHGPTLSSVVSPHARPSSVRHRHPCPAGPGRRRSCTTWHCRLLPDPVSGPPLSAAAACPPLHAAATHGRPCPLDSTDRCPCTIETRLISPFCRLGILSCADSC